MVETAELKIQPARHEGRTSDYLEVAFSKDWVTIYQTMDFFISFVESRIEGYEESHKVGTAVSELLENAVKYSYKDIVRISMLREAKGNTISFNVYNYARKDHAKRLLKRIQELNKSDSLTFYLNRMRESVKNKEESAGLGLARIYHETNAKMKARYFRIKKLVEVSATITIV